MPRESARSDGAGSPFAGGRPCTRWVPPVGLRAVQGAASRTGAHTSTAPPQASTPCCRRRTVDPQPADRRGKSARIFRGRDHRRTARRRGRPSRTCVSNGSAAHHRVACKEGSRQHGMWLRMCGRRKVCDCRPGHMKWGRCDTAGCASPGGHPSTSATQAHSKAGGPRSDRAQYRCAHRVSRPRNGSRSRVPLFHRAAEARGRSRRRRSRVALEALRGMAGNCQGGRSLHRCESHTTEACRKLEGRDAPHAPLSHSLDSTLHRSGDCRTSSCCGKPACRGSPGTRSRAPLCECDDICSQAWRAPRSYHRRHRGTGGGTGDCSPPWAWRRAGHTAASGQRSPCACLPNARGVRTQPHWSNPLSCRRHIGRPRRPAREGTRRTPLGGRDAHTRGSHSQSCAHRCHRKRRAPRHKGVAPYVHHSGTAARSSLCIADTALRGTSGSSCVCHMRAACCMLPRRTTA
mmetsp:Transcript_15415/g.33943  ORF Transcript_15415/g.33943 Transcript_15415/m.33943 type:complete len:461 (+) Transcript_15415:916-2298(+)